MYIEKILLAFLIKHFLIPPWWWWNLSFQNISYFIYIKFQLLFLEIIIFYFLVYIFSYSFKTIIQHLFLRYLVNDVYWNFSNLTKPILKSFQNASKNMLKASTHPLRHQWRKCHDEHLSPRNHPHLHLLQRLQAHRRQPTDLCVPGSLGWTSHELLRYVTVEEIGGCF